MVETDLIRASQQIKELPGIRYVEPRSLQLVPPLDFRNVKPLSLRQSELAGALAGKRMVDYSQEQGLDLRTVSSHVVRIGEKLGFIPGTYNGYVCRVGSLYLKWADGKEKGETMDPILHSLWLNDEERCGLDLRAIRSRVAFTARELQLMEWIRSSHSVETMGKTNCYAKRTIEGLVTALKKKFADADFAIHDYFNLRLISDYILQGIEESKQTQRVIDPETLSVVPVIDFASLEFGMREEKLFHLVGVRRPLRASLYDLGITDATGFILINRIAQKLRLPIVEIDTMVRIAQLYRIWKATGKTAVYPSLHLAPSERTRVDKIMENQTIEMTQETFDFLQLAVKGKTAGEIEHIMGKSKSNGRKVETAVIDKFERAGIPVYTLLDLHTFGAYLLDTAKVSVDASQSEPSVE